LLYLRDNRDDQTRHALMVLNTDGSGTARVIRQGIGLSCDWSADGRHLLTEAQGHLLLLDLHGAGAAIPVDVSAASRGSRDRVLGR
jgi:hypothetical protein